MPAHPVEILNRKNISGILLAKKVGAFYWALADLDAIARDQNLYVIGSIQPQKTNIIGNFNIFARLRNDDDVSNPFTDFKPAIGGITFNSQPVLNSNGDAMPEFNYDFVVEIQPQDGMTPGAFPSQRAFLAVAVLIRGNAAPAAVSEKIVSSRSIGGKFGA